MGHHELGLETSSNSHPSLPAKETKLLEKLNEYIAFCMSHVDLTSFRFSLSLHAFAMLT